MRTNSDDGLPTNQPSDQLPANRQVIKAFPDYPKIRKDILEKARMGLKP